MSQKDRTVTRSFRISESAFKALEEDARKQNISMNTLVNQLFLSYANFDRFAKKLRMVKLTTATIRRIFEAASDKAIIDAGHSAGDSVPEAFILTKNGVVSLQTVLAFLRDLADHAGLFDYSEVSHEGERTITLLHELGPKGSMFLAHYVQSVFGRIDLNPAFSISDDAIVIEL